MNLKMLRKRRAKLLKEAEGFKKADGTFADDKARADFDAKMILVDELDAQIREIEESDEDEAPAAAATVTAEQRTAIAAEERTRINDITKAVRVAGLGQELAADMIGRNLTLDQVRAEIFDKLAAQSEQNPTRSAITFGEDARDKFMRGATNWLLIKGGVAADVARSEKVELSSIDAGEFRGLTLLDLARMTLERAGRSVRGLDKMRLVAEAFTVRTSITQSTSDFTTLLENTMHKVLLAAYAIQPDTWRQFCATSTVSDFRAHNRYRLGSFGTLDTVSENGEFKRKSIPDGEKASISAATKGNIINVSRQMIVNDDMNAFARLPQMLGRAAARSVEVDVYALLAENAGLGPTMSDSLALFDAGHSNISTAAALSAAAIDADRVTMAEQTDQDGNDYIDLRPAILLLNTSLGGVARVINQSQFDPDTVANKAQMKPNVSAGLFRVIVDTPRVAGTRRYLFADPGVAPVLEVAFLEGQAEPVLETKDGWDVDGSELKVRYDYGVGAVDYRGAVTNAGQ